MAVEDYSVDDGYECPTCDKVVNTSLGLKQHHTKVHGETLRQTSVCEWCDEGFYVKPTQVGNFCSKECQMERRKSEGVPARKRRVTVACEGCGEDMELVRSDVGHKKYCSLECRRDGGMVNCEICGDEFYAHDSYESEARFCSQDCYGVWLSRNTSGVNSPHWRGDERVTDDDYGPGWTERLREQVRDRDRRRCTECGIPESDHVSERGMKLHVHHEVIARESSNPAVYNSPRNLRTLCVGCHMSVH